MPAKTLFSARKSAKGPNRRAIRFEPLEERCLLAIQAIPIVVAATDSVAAEGTDGNTGAWRIMRYGPDIVPCVAEFRIDGSADFTLQTSDGASVTLTSHTEGGVTYRTGAVLIEEDESEVTLLLTPTNDAKREESETVSIQLTGYYSAISYVLGTATPSITILDNDDWVVSVSATDTVAAEASASSPNYGTYTITRSNETDTTHFLNIRFELSGTASTSDYSLFTENGTAIEIQHTVDPVTQTPIDYGFVTIPSGSLSTTVQLRPNNDAAKEDTESVIMTLVPHISTSGLRDYSVSGIGAAVSIGDNDDWTVSVTATDSVAAEGTASNPNYGVYTITRSNETDTTHDLYVHFQMTGTALGSSDYRLYKSDGTQVSLTSSFDPVSQTNVYTGGVRIPANALSTTVELRPVDDHLAERDETAVFTIVPNNNVYYAVDPNNNGATVTIEESTVVTLTTVDETALEPCTWISAADRKGAFRLTVETTETDWLPIYVQLGISGTAEPGNNGSFGDYHLTSNTGGSMSGIGTVSDGQVTVTIPAGQTQFDFYVMPNTDLLYEPDEDVILEIIQAYSGSNLNQIDYDDTDAEAVEILQAPEFVSGNEIFPLGDVNTDGYVKYFDPKSPQLSLLGGAPIAAANPSGRLCRYAFYDAENGNSLTSSEENPLLSINAFSGTITVLRTMTDTEKASAQVFTIKVYDSVYNDLYDLATLTIYALDYGLTPYTPQTHYIGPMAIEEAAWKQNGVGIRRNNDHDCSTGDNPPPDSVISTANAKEDDLIRVDVNVDNSIPGLTYSVLRSSSALKFWKGDAKANGEYDFTNNEFSLTGSRTLWAEYTTAGNDNYTLTLVVRETASNTILAIQSMTFRPFNSITCAFVGEFQIAGNPTEDPGVNDWVIDQLKNGYDVHVWDDGFDPSIDDDYVPDCAPNGSGNAFDTIKNAVNNSGVTDIAIIGYSHGGGSVYNLSCYLDADLNSNSPEITETYSLVFTSYIDAIQNTSHTSTDPVELRPINSQFHLNQYQLNQNLSSGYLHGAATCGGTTDNTKNKLRSLLDHGEIDEIGRASCRERV